MHQQTVSRDRDRVKGVKMPLAYLNSLSTLLFSLHLFPSLEKKCIVTADRLERGVFFIVFKKLRVFFYPARGKEM